MELKFGDNNKASVGFVCTRLFHKELSVCDLVLVDGGGAAKLISLPKDHANRVWDLLLRFSYSRALLGPITAFLLSPRPTTAKTKPILCLWFCLVYPTLFRIHKVMDQSFSITYLEANHKKTALLTFLYGSDTLHLDIVYRISSVEGFLAFN